jgi:hypothetical protein
MGPAASLRRVPAKQALGRERLGVLLGGVQHHIDHAIHLAVGWDHIVMFIANVHAQPAGDRGAHGVQVEGLAFNGAGGDDFLGEGLRRG